MGLILPQYAVITHHSYRGEDSRLLEQVGWRNAKWVFQMK